MGMVELDIDEETGQVRIKRLISVADVGKGNSSRRMHWARRGCSDDGDRSHVF